MAIRAERVSGDDSMQLDDERHETARQAVVIAERIDRQSRAPAPKAHESLVALHQPAGAAAEAFRGLYYALRRSVGGSPLGVLAVASAARGEGRSTVAANLALVAARETGRPVALVDADLRAPALHRLFGVDGEVGLSDVLANRADLEAVVYEHPNAHVALIGGGRPEAEPARRFTSPRFARFLAQVRGEFAETVIDLPPLACVDARLIAAQCSGVVLVVRSGQTEAQLARDSLEELEGARVLGAVLNGAAGLEAPQLRAARRALPPGR